MAGFTGNEARRIIELIITGDSAGAVRAIEKTTLASTAARRKIEEDNARQQRTFERLAGTIDNVGRSMERFNISRVGRTVGGMGAIGRGALATTRHLGNMARAMDRISTSRLGQTIGVLQRGLGAVGRFGAAVGVGIGRGAVRSPGLLWRQALRPGLIGSGGALGVGSLLGLGALGGAGAGVGLLGAGMFESVRVAAKHHNYAAQQSMAALKDLRHTAMQAVTKIGGALAPIVTRFAHAFMPIIGSITKAIMPLSKSLAKVVPPLTAALGTFLPQLVSGFVQLAPIMVNTITKALPLLMTVFQGVGSLLAHAMTTLLPPVEKALREIIPPLVSAINGLMPPVAALIPPLVSALKMILPPLISALRQLVPPLAQALGRLVTALAPVIVRLINTVVPVIYMLIRALVPPLVHMVAKLAPVMVQMIRQLAPPIVNLVKQLVPPLAQFVKTGSSVILELAKTMIRLLPPLTKALTLLTPALVGVLKDFNKGFGRITHPGRFLSSAAHTASHDFWSEAPWGSNPFGLGSIFHSRGGLIGPMHLAGGGPVGTDTVPAWLTPGEFVLTRAAAQRVGIGMLNALNAGTPLTSERIVIEPQPVTLRLDSRALTEAVARYTLKRNARGSTSLVGGGIVTGTTFS